MKTKQNSDTQNNKEIVVEVKGKIKINIVNVNCKKCINISAQ